MWLELTLAAIAALVLSLGLTRVMIAVGPRLGLMDAPDERRIHTTPIPRAGGIAIWLSFALVIGGGLATGLLSEVENLSWSWFGAFLAGSAVLLVVGIYDDRKGLNAWVKLGGHVLAPSILFLMHPIHTGLVPDSCPAICDFLLFVVWVVVLINAFNLIDGLDGLCAGLSAVSTLALAGLALANGRMDSAVLLVVMSGAVFGFLRYNTNPARIFLGDAGSMLLGFFIATVATDAVGRRVVLGMVMLPIAVAGVPLLDVLLAIWRRGSRRIARRIQGEAAGVGLFDADRDHLHHRLLDSGKTQRKVALLLQGLAVVLTFLAFLPMLFGEKLIGVSLVGFLIVGMLGLRSLARVEFQSTGSVVHLAIKLPGWRRRLAAALFLYDLLMLAAAAGLAILIETNRLTKITDPESLWFFLLLFTVFGSWGLLVIRVHRQLWARATTRDVLLVQSALLISSLATFSLFELVVYSFEWSALRMTVMACAFASGAVCIPRMALVVLREAGFTARHRTPMTSHGTHDHPVVVLGAGDLGTLLLDHLKTSSHDLYPGLRILGFVDETRQLHGRQLRSFRVLGGLSVVPGLVAHQGLKGVILAINQPTRELVDELTALVERYDLKVHRWNAGIVMDA